MSKQPSWGCLSSWLETEWNIEATATATAISRSPDWWHWALEVDPFSVRIFCFWTPQRIVLITPVRSSQCEVLERALWEAEDMRVYYEDSYRYGHHHHHHRPSKQCDELQIDWSTLMIKNDTNITFSRFVTDIEIDVFTGYGGAYYPPPIVRPEVVVVNPAQNYMPGIAGGQMVMAPPPPPPPPPQPYGGAMPYGVAGSTGYYQQQQGYQYQQYQQYNNPPYPRW